MEGKRLTRREPLKEIGNLEEKGREHRHIKLEWEEELKFRREDTTTVHSPSEELLRRTYNLLVGEYGKPRRQTEGNSSNACGRKNGVVEAVISVILSQNTSDKNSSRAMNSLFKAFPDGVEQIRQASTEEIEGAIRSGGLANIKSKRIHEFLKRVYEEFGVTSLEHLREKSNEEVKEALSKYKGLGPKTISCVMLFTLHRPDFTVDTHVHRVANRLGWVSTKSAREKTYKILNERIPDELKYDLHVLMIKHGRQICSSQNPKCYKCPVVDVCDFTEKNLEVVHKRKVKAEVDVKVTPISKRRRIRVKVEEKEETKN